MPGGHLGRVFLGGRAAGRPPAVAAQASKRPLLGWRMMEADRLTSIRSFVHREVAKLQTWQGFGAEGEPRPPRPTELDPVLTPWLKYRVARPAATTRSTRRTLGASLVGCTPSDITRRCRRSRDPQILTSAWRNLGPMTRAAKPSSTAMAPLAALQLRAASASTITRSPRFDR